MQDHSRLCKTAACTYCLWYQGTELPRFGKESQNKRESEHARDTPEFCCSHHPRSTCSNVGIRGLFPSCCSLGSGLTALLVLWLRAVPLHPAALPCSPLPAPACPLAPSQAGICTSREWELATECCSEEADGIFWKPRGLSITSVTE